MEVLPTELPQTAYTAAREEVVQDITRYTTVVNIKQELKRVQESMLPKFTLKLLPLVL